MEIKACAAARSASAAAVIADTYTSNVSDKDTETRPLLTAQDVHAKDSVQSALEAIELKNYEAEEPPESEWLRLVNEAEDNKIERGYPKIASTDGWPEILSMMRFVAQPETYTRHSREMRIMRFS